MNFKEIEKRYRPIPFWSWNSKLDKEETKRQIEIMDKAGMGGYFMHARGGLTTEYMGKEWFDNIAIGIEDGNKRGMQPWAYDENGWPSGIGDGLVNGLGEEYQQKYLRWDKDITNTERTICVNGEYRFYYEVNPFYVDTLDAKVTDKFIEKIYQPYYDKFKDSFNGFFCDEPHISRNGIPWSLILPEEYEKEYNESLYQKLGELFFGVGDYENTRLKFWRLVTKLFSQNFMKRIYDWCTEHNLGLTGHILLEETLYDQLTTNGACMPHYEYFTMPGMDWLGREVFDCFTPLQVSSVAHQLGKKEILSETFALCGHNVGFDELKAILQWQMVHGITKLCQHLEGYSLQGLRKRDYPPAMYYQQPWWEEYALFNESMSRIGKILSEGRVEYDTLLLHNQSSGWKCFDNDKNGELQKYNDALLNDYKTLMQKHILFHFGDEIIIERHARVEGNEFVIGTQRYKTVVIPENKGFFENTQRLLNEFEKNGGIITTADKVKENNICSSPLISYTERKFDGYKVYYFINNNNQTVEADFTKGGKVMNITTGEVSSFEGSYTFAPHDSLILIDEGSKFSQNKEKKCLKKLDLSDKWEITHCSENILTLDTCDVYFDGVLVGEKENAADVTYMALDLKRNVNVRCDYKFNVKDIPENAFLVCETPEKFKILVNGKEIDKTDRGYFADTSFRKISLCSLLKTGENVISTQLDFAPNPKVYEDLEKAMVFETEKNKLTVDTEIESIYIIGDFAVNTEGKFELLERNAVRYGGEFEIALPKKEIELSNIQQQGFPFFSGRITLKKTFNVDDVNYGIFFEKKGVNAVNVKVNGIDCGSIMWGHLMCDLSDALCKGENIVELTLVNNLRNMLGPHHLPEGESYFVAPIHFYKRDNVWTKDKWAQTDDRVWDNNYCFAQVGIYNN